MTDEEMAAHLRAKGWIVNGPPGEILLRRQQALQMCKAGLKFREIGEKLNVSTSRARSLVVKACEDNGISYGSWHPKEEFDASP